jgi:hypothetical protein
VSSGPNAFSPVDLPPLLTRRLQLLVDEHHGMSGGDCPACGDILPCRIGLDAQRQLDMSGCSAVGLLRAAAEAAVPGESAEAMARRYARFEAQYGRRSR